jgi:HlyD family secretion protein
MNRKLWVGIVAILIVLGAGSTAWFRFAADDIPSGLVMSNGRLEAERIDIATKFAGRVQNVLVEEGDYVTAGQILAKLDTTDLDIQLLEAEALERQSEQQLDQAIALHSQRANELLLADKELERSRSLVTQGFVSAAQLDQRQATKVTAEATLNGAKAVIEQSKSSIQAAIARVEHLKYTLNEHVLTAPREGRVQYRLAQPGEVLGVGGKVLTLLDLTEVYMTIFLPTNLIGQLELGAEARIIPDAAPDYVVPARVSFVAANAQFTPKFVETLSEREKLMYRVKVQIPKDVLHRYATRVKAGITGVAWVKIVNSAVWPEHLQVRLPELTDTQG